MQTTLSKASNESIQNSQQIDQITQEAQDIQENMNRTMAIAQKNKEQSNHLGDVVGHYKV